MSIKFFHKRYPQKMYTKSVQNKCLQTVSTTNVYKKCGKVEKFKYTKNRKVEK